MFTTIITTYYLKKKQLNAKRNNLDSMKATAGQQQQRKHTHMRTQAHTLTNTHSHFFPVGV